MLLTVGYGRGSALLKVTCGADKKWSVEPVWETKTMKTKFTTAVAHDGYVYGLDDGIMQCIDLKTGSRNGKGAGTSTAKFCLRQLDHRADGAGTGRADRGHSQAADGARHDSRPVGPDVELPALAGKYLLVRNDREAACYEVALKN